MTKDKSNERKIRWFKPLHSTQRTKSVLAFDVEGSGVPDGFVCGAISGYHTAGFYTNREQMWQDLLRYGEDGTWLFAHNLEYDLPIVAGHHLWEGKLVFKTGGILWADFRFNKRRVRFMDSSNLFAYWSVKRLGEMIGKAKGEVSDEMIQRLGGGASWNSFTLEEQELIRKYCIQDAHIVALSVLQLQEEVNDLGGELKPTLAGISMDIFRREYLHIPWMVLHKDVNEAMRPAYYGGRVENYVFGKVENANLYDINSLYPFILRTGTFPHPSYLRFVEGKAARRVLDTWEGVASGRVVVKDTNAPSLPYRTGGKLFFPTGEMVGLWTLSELRNAINHDAELIELDWIFGSASLFNPFEEYIEHLYKLRKGYIAEKDERHLLLKLIMNSLYGRFGLNPNKGLIQLMMIEGKPDWEKLQGWSTRELNGKLVATGPLTFNHYPSYANVILASQVSSLARIELHNALLKAGNDMIYCDTDSILMRGEMDTGNALGEWKCQMQEGKASLLGPKEYILHNKNTADKYIVKGVPKKHKEEYVKTGMVRYRKAVKIREAIARGANPAEWVETFKAHHPTLPKRLPVLPEKKWSEEYCQTVPWSVQQLQNALSSDVSELPQTHPSQLQGLLPEWVIPLLADYE